jgi:hypothetical protein
LALFAEQLLMQSLSFVSNMMAPDATLKPYHAQWGLRSMAQKAAP